MQPLSRGIYTARLADGPQDMAASLALRHLCFRAGAPGISDADAFDAVSRHMLVSDSQSGAPVASFRVQGFAIGQSLSGGYTAQVYDLTPLQAHPGAKVELGRFCLHPGHTDPDILRLAWASLTHMVDAAGATLLFGCTSFAGADPALHRVALGHLARHHLGPAPLRPRRRAAETVALTDLPQPDHLPPLPPLLRTYLAMGGWVSDHAVLDRDLDTTHVFTALDIAAIPPARARALRALAY